MAAELTASCDDYTQVGVSQRAYFSRSRGCAPGYTRRRILIESYELETSVAQPNYRQQKKQRETAKKKKNDEKRERRARTPDSTEPEAPSTDKIG